MTNEQNTTTALELFEAKSPVLAASQVQPVRHDPLEGDFNLLLDTAKFDHLQRVAKLFSSSNIVPAHFQGKFADTFVALHMAMRLRIDPMMFLQKCYVVSGKLGIESQLAIALINKSGLFTTLEWEFKGKEGDDSFTCVCSAKRKSTGKVVSTSLSVAEVKAHGWYSKTNSFWPKMLRQMLQYRTASYFVRLYAPEVLLGLYTKEEIIDIEPEHAPVIEVKSEPVLEAPKVKEPVKFTSQELNI